MVSRPDGSADQQGTAASGFPNLSADGVQVAFVSQSALVTGVESPPEGFHTYARAVGTTGTTLVSRATGAAGAPAGARSLPAGLSADGHLITFNSAAGNLGGPGDDVPAVYLRDLSAETTNLVSGPPGTAAGAGDASDPATSADGRFVAFLSGADGLSDANDDRFKNVYRRDTVTGALSLVSRGPSGAAEGDSREPLISEDGRRVAFESAARNLGTDLNGFDGVWAMDVETGTVELASRGDGAAGTPAQLCGEHVRAQRRRPPRRLRHRRPARRRTRHQPRPRHLRSRPRCRHHGAGEPGHRRGHGRRERQIARAGAESRRESRGVRVRGLRPGRR